MAMPFSCSATNPSAFKLELFVNNLTRPNAATFEKLGLWVLRAFTSLDRGIAIVHRMCFVLLIMILYRSVYVIVSEWILI